MSQWQHLPKAPITEALIDIRVEVPDGTEVQSLSAFREEVCGDYPTCRERRKWHGQLVFRKTEAPAVQAAAEGPDGYLLTSKDGNQIVQARLDGFTFSRLKPYETWERLRGSARRLWKPYCHAAKPAAITRIAVRYVNRLELPIPIKDFREWTLTAPEIAPDLPQDLAGFFMRLNLSFEDPKGFVNITQTIEPGEYDECVPLIFDIDAFWPQRFDPDDEKAWHKLEDLRAIKNRVFFGSITDKMQERFL